MIAAARIRPSGFTHDPSVSVSQCARRSRYGRASVREQRIGHCAARWRLRQHMPGGTDGSSASCRLRQHEYRFWKQHQFARRIYFAKFDAESEEPLRPGQPAVEHHERCRLWRLYRLQHAMGSTRPRFGSRLQIREHATGANDSMRGSSRHFNTSDSIEHIVTVNAQIVQARRLCGFARARRLCLGPIPALCGGRSRRRTLQLRTTVTVTDSQTHSQSTRPSLAHSSNRPAMAKTNAFVAGVAAGLGVDWAATPKRICPRRMGIRRFRAGQSEPAPTFRLGISALECGSDEARVIAQTPH